jgi:hypothetical protein
MSHTAITIHPPSKCLGYHCPWHNPSAHHMVGWTRVIRTDRDNLIERVCHHGVGHPDPDSVSWLGRRGVKIVHERCCGCCRLPRVAQSQEAAVASPITMERNLAADDSRAARPKPLVPGADESEGRLRGRGSPKRQTLAPMLDRRRKTWVGLGILVLGIIAIRVYDHAKENERRLVQEKQSQSDQELIARLSQDLGALCADVERDFPRTSFADCKPAPSRVTTFGLSAASFNVCSQIEGTQLYEDWYRFYDCKFMNEGPPEPDSP